VKSIGATSRAELERLFGRRVHLFLFVRVSENWADDLAHYDAIGLDFES
jgi:GTP-binding protein Era